MDKPKPKINATSRIPLTPEAFDIIRGFARGADMEYSELVKVLLSQYIQPDEDPIEAGARFRLATQRAMENKEDVQKKLR